MSTAAPARGAVRSAMPEAQAPQLCMLAETPPEGAAWLSEIKFDGYRLLVAIEGGKIRLLTRNGHDWADRMPSIAAAFKSLPVTSAMLDGELVSLAADGVSSFPGLQSALKGGRDDTLTFYAFDLLHLDGWDLRGCPLVERKRILAGLADWTGMLRYSDHHVGDTHAMLKGACQMKLEGIICKKADAVYRPGRGADWLKVKCSGREELSSSAGQHLAVDVFASAPCRSATAIRTAPCSMPEPLERASTTRNWRRSIAASRTWPWLNRRTT